MAKLKYKYMRTVRLHIENVRPFLQSALKVQVLESLTVPQDVVFQHTEYKDSVEETFIGQNLSCGLTNISDLTFEFFLELESSRIPLYASTYLSQHSGNLLKFVRSTLINDNELFQKWVTLIAKDFTTLKYNCSSSLVNNSSIDEVLNTTVDAAVATLDLFQVVIGSYCNVTDNEYRKRLRSEMGRKKEMEHRTKVLLRAQSKKVATPISLDDINADTSSNKITSHRKLRDAVLQNVEKLKDFKKSELVEIAGLYGEKYSLSRKKDVLAEKVATPLIKTKDHMSASPGSCKATKAPEIALDIWGISIQEIGSDVSHIFPGTSTVAT